MPYEPIPQIEQAIAAVSMMVMAESLNSSLPPEQHQKGHAALMALKEAWPKEYAESRERVKFVPAPNGFATQAMYLTD